MPFVDILGNDQGSRDCTRLALSAFYYTEIHCLATLWIASDRPKEEIAHDELVSV
jgi:hypothetical protein